MLHVDMEKLIIKRPVDVVPREIDSIAVDAMNSIKEYMIDNGDVDDHPEKNHARCAIISPCRHSFVNGEPSVDDKDRINYFPEDTLEFDKYRLRLNYEYGGEELFFIKDISLGEAMSIAATYWQNTFIYKDAKGCREICSKPFISANGDCYEISDVVNEYLVFDEMYFRIDDFARILASKVKTCEIFGSDIGNAYPPKEDYDLYYFSRPWPLNPSIPNYGNLQSYKYLIHQEVKNENR